jgi:ferrous iron transport protein B
VVPTMLMVYTAGGMMTDMQGFDQLRSLLIGQHGWTLLTAVNLMLFSLLHNPCATTIVTIYKETLSVKWATIGAVMPLVLAFIVTFATAALARAVLGF